MKNQFIKKFIKLMKGELTGQKRPKRHFSWSINETKYLDIKKVKKLRIALIKARASGPDKLITARNWFMVNWVCPQVLGLKKW
jgi:hypothetical protein